MLQEPPGFYTLFSPHKDATPVPPPLVFFASTCQGTVWALQLDRLSNRIFCVNADALFHQAMQPLRTLAKAMAVSDTAQVRRTELEHKPAPDNFLRMFISGSHPVDRHTRAPPSKASSSTDHSTPLRAKKVFESDSDSEATFGSNTDVEALWTDVGSDAEKEREEQEAAKASKASAADPEPPLSDEGEEDAEERVGDPKAARLPWRTHVVEGDSYFSYINNKGYPNVRVGIAGC